MSWHLSNDTVKFLRKYNWMFILYWFTPGDFNLLSRSWNNKNFTLMNNHNLIKPSKKKNSITLFKLLNYKINFYLVKCIFFLHENEIQKCLVLKLNKAKELSGFDDANSMCLKLEAFNIWISRLFEFNSMFPNLLGLYIVMNEWVIQRTKVLLKQNFSVIFWVIKMLLH